MLQLSPAAMLLINYQGVIQVAKGAGLKNLGFEASDLEGKDILKIPRMPVRSMHLKRALKGVPFSSTTKIDSKYFETHYAPEKNTDQTSILIAVSEVTKKINNESVLDQELYRKTIEVETMQKDQKEMLDNMNQAVLTISPELKINRGFSAALLKILEQKDQLVGQDVFETIFDKTNITQDQKRRLEFDLRSLFGSDSLQWMCSSHAFPEKLLFNGIEKKTTIKITYKPIYNYFEKISRVMLIIEDITTLESLQQEAKGKQEELEKISDILAVEDKVYAAFMAEAENIIALCQKDFTAILDTKKQLKEEDKKPIKERLFRSIHTLKGSSGLFKLRGIQNAAHQMEDFLEGIRQKDDPKEMDKEAFFEKLRFIEQEVGKYHDLRQKVTKKDLSDNFQSFSQSHLEWLIDIINRMTQTMSNPETTTRDIDSILYELKGALNCVGQVPIHQYINRFSLLTQELSEKYKKELAPLRFYTSIHYFESHFISALSEIIVHCLNNAVCHGIESFEKRAALSKPKEGKINIRITDRDNKMRLIIEDDGRGIDSEKIAEIAVQKGLITEEKRQSLSGEEKNHLIFLPHLSSKKQADLHRGRGVGMDAIRDKVLSLGGDIRLESEASHGTRVIINLPRENKSPIFVNSLYDGKKGVYSCFKKALEDKNPYYILGPKHSIDRVFAELDSLLGTYKIDFDLQLSYDPMDSFVVSINMKNLSLHSEQKEKFAMKIDFLQTLIVAIEGAIVLENAAIKVSLPTGLKEPLSSMPLNIICSSQNCEKPALLMKQFLEDKYQLSARILASSKTQSSEDAFNIAVCDDAFLKDHLLPSDKSTICVILSSNPDLLSGHLFKGLINQPILAKLPASKAALQQLAELAMVIYLETCSKKTQKDSDFSNPIAS